MVICYKAKHLKINKHEKHSYLCNFTLVPFRICAMVILKSEWIKHFLSQSCLCIQHTERLAQGLNQHLVAMETLDYRIFALFLQKRKPLIKIRRKHSITPNFTLKIWILFLSLQRSPDVTICRSRYSGTPQRAARYVFTADFMWG